MEEVIGLKGINHLTIAILNLLAAVFFVIAVVISDFSELKITIGYSVVAALFVFTGVANIIKHYKKN
ncbi:hypothetical protein D3C76_1559560 [compost metagenome]